MDPTGFSYQSAELQALASAQNYYGWIMGHFLPYVGGRVVEVGAGIGTFSEVLLKVPKLSELVLIEPADNLWSLLQQRFREDKRVSVLHGYLEEIGSSLEADSVVLVNVLEHLEDDEGLLERIHNLLVPGGTVLLFVPALPWLYGALDDAFGHVRRYTKDVLAGRLRRAGFRVVHLRYFNLVGVLTWLVAARILRLRTLRARDIRIYDRWMVPWISKVERYWEPPVGQSLVAVGGK